MNASLDWTSRPAAACVDEPAPDAPVDPLNFQVRGWIWLPWQEGTVTAIEAWAGDTLIGATLVFFPRADVSTALGLPPGANVGFEFFCHHPAAPFGSAFELSLRSRISKRNTTVFAQCQVRAIARDYRTAYFGVMLDRGTTAIQRRPNIHTSGPSISAESAELSQRLRHLLGSPPCRVLDIGCGLGAYGPGLLRDGYEWMGAEMKAADCAELARQGLPHRRVDGATLPFDDGEFDAGMCIEVLEHLDDPTAFLREAHRVSPRRLVVSVPNCEALTYLSAYLAVPWHMLEADHKNFFTRWSLGALLRQFYPQVEISFHTPHPLRTPEGHPVYYHLLAVATG